MQKSHSKKYVSEEPRFYPYDGKKLPSVTTITHTMGDFEFKGYLDEWKISHGDYKTYKHELEKTQVRGKKVHAACEKILIGQSPASLVGIKPYVSAFVNWKKQIWEDLYFSNSEHIIDIKTSKKAPAKPWPLHKIQVVAYGKAPRLLDLEAEVNIRKGRSFSVEITVADEKVGYAGTADIEITDLNHRRKNYWVLYLDAEGGYRFHKVVDVELCYRIFKAQVKQFNRWQQLK